MKDPPKTVEEYQARDKALVARAELAKSEGKPTHAFEHARELNAASFVEYARRNGLKVR